MHVDIEWSADELAAIEQDLDTAERLARRIANASVDAWPTVHERLLQERDYPIFYAMLTQLSFKRPEQAGLARAAQARLELVDD